MKTVQEKLKYNESDLDKKLREKLQKLTDYIHGKYPDFKFLSIDYIINKRG